MNAPSALLFAPVILLLAACGDSVTQTSGNGGGGSSTTSSADGGAGVGGTNSVGGSDPGDGGAASDPCFAGCEAFWECTQLDYQGSPLCPGLQGLSVAKDPLIDGCLESAQCTVVGQLVGNGTDPMTCSSALALIASMSTEFSAACNGN